VAGGTLTAHLYQSFHTFAPWDTSGTGGDLVVESLVWDMLAIYDETGAVSYRLADSITPNADATEWTVKLKSGVQWSDGTAFTSKDVLFSWKINANPDQSPNAALWDEIVGIADWRKGGDYSQDIAGLTAPDDGTVVFKLANPDGAFLSTLLNFRNMILPSAAMTPDKLAGADVFKLDTKGLYALPFWQGPPVAIGPYKWDKTETGQYLQFSRNDHYYGGTPPFDTVIMKDIPDAAVAAAQAQSGDLDFAQVALPDLSGLAAAGLSTGTAVAPFPIESDYNTSPSSPMQDVRVRQAFMYGCDRQGFVDSFLQGKGQKTDSYFLPSWIPKDGTKTYSFDLDKAKALLDAAKADGKFDYTTTIRWMSWNKNARDRQSFVEACQATMAQIGVKIEIINGAEVTTAAGQQGKWDLQLYGGYPVQDPNTLTQPLSCAQVGKTKRANGYLDGGSNVTDWCNKDFDALMAQGKAIADQSQRAAIYAKAQDIFLDQVPIQINYINANAYAWSSKLTGVRLFGDPTQIMWGIMDWRKAS
jgi:ABC-type transport system substrate-binding protein